MSLHIRGGRLVDPSLNIDGCRDLWIEDGEVRAILQPGEKVSGKATQEFDAQGAVVAPGFVDLHVHLREPGDIVEEDIESGTRAAVAGGFTSILCMPNTRPVNDCGDVTNRIVSRAREVGHCHVYPVGALTKSLSGRELSPFNELVKAGCIAFSDDGRSCADTVVFRQVMKLAKELDVLVIEHCEECSDSSRPTIHDGMVAKQLGLRGLPYSCETLDVARTSILAVETRARVHLAHLSTAASVDLLRTFKPWSCGLSAEVTPHHLLLDEEAVFVHGTNAKMYPPLRTRLDCEALRQALTQGWIDVVATDHAPHTEKEKKLSFKEAPNGVIGLETALPVLNTLVASGEISLPRLIASLSGNPARIARLRAGSLAVGMPADIVVFSQEEDRDFYKEDFVSKSKNSPFLGFQGRGRVHATFVSGQQVFGEKT